MVHKNRVKSPYEQIFGRKPNLSYMRPFGCICDTLIPSEIRNKLEQTSEKCRLTGHPDNMRGYKLLREYDRGMVFSNDVKCDLNQDPESLIQNENYFYENESILIKTFEQSNSEIEESEDHETIQQLFKPSE